MNAGQSRRTFEIERYGFDRETIDRLAEHVWLKNYWPIVYILTNSSEKQVYVGESASAINRFNAHLNNSQKRLLDRLHIILSPQFHKSATLDIEASLIRYFDADDSAGKYKLMNGTFGLTFHNYYQREDYQKLFADIWQKLQEEKIAIQDLQAIDNSDLFKYSPYKALSPDQYQSVFELIDMLTGPYASALVEGGAGTGKTVLAIFMIKLLVAPWEELYNADIELTEEEYSGHVRIAELKTLYPKPKVALVVPMESLRNTLKSVFREVKGLAAGMVISPSDVVGKHYDILIVDEAHRLRQRKNLTNYRSFDANNKKLGYGKEGTELDWIRDSSTKQIYFYDHAQSVRPSDVDKSRFGALRKLSRQIKLRSQLRVKGGNDYINYIEALLSLSLPENEAVFEQENYEFLYFDRIADLSEVIAEKEKESRLARMMAGYSWPWRSRKEPEAMDIEIEGLRLQWNRKYDRWINSKNASREVGCIHTTQGYDLNYAGVIFGNEISYDRDRNKLNIDPKRFYDKKTKAGIKDINILKYYILNSYQNMLYRGMKGVFIYACDPGLKAYFKEHVRSYNA